MFTFPTLSKNFIYYQCANITLYSCSSLFNNEHRAEHGEIKTFYVDHIAILNPLTDTYFTIAACPDECLLLPNVNRVRYFSIFTAL